MITRVISGSVQLRLGLVLEELADWHTRIVFDLISLALFDEHELVYPRLCGRDAVAEMVHGFLTCKDGRAQ